VVIIGGSAVTMSHWIEDVSSVIYAWYPGQEGGRAVADVLFGDYNPSGRLPVTFPISEAQLPLVYNHKPTGRGDDYNNLTGLPLFPFGYGLSYTNFEYSNLTSDKDTISDNESVRIHFNLKNTGKYAGEEVVQLYIRDELASVARPVLELKGFKRIYLSPQETKEVTFTITPELLKMYNHDMKEVIEPGEFRIMIGPSSRELKLKRTITVK
jgi:beta-glucosidase